jgi:hypothetical protein
MNTCDVLAFASGRVHGARHQCPNDLLYSVNPCPGIRGIQSRRKWSYKPTSAGGLAGERQAWSAQLQHTLPHTHKTTNHFCNYEPEVVAVSGTMECLESMFSLQS